MRWLGNFVLPLSAGVSDSEVFWALVELLDPDWWSVYGGSAGELEDFNPASYTTWRTDVDQQLATVPEDERARLLVDAHDEPLVDSPMPDALHALLAARGTTLHHDGRMLLRGPASATGAPAYPSVDVFELDGLPAAVTEMELPDDPTLALLCAAEFGALSADQRNELDRRGVRRESQRSPSNAELMRTLGSARKR